MLSIDPKLDKLENPPQTSFSSLIDTFVQLLETGAQNDSGNAQHPGLPDELLGFPDEEQPAGETTDEEQPIEEISIDFPDVRLENTEYSFGTYNSFGDKGVDTQAELDKIDDFASKTDVVGFQEARPELVGQLMDTHSVFYGSGENPIFFNKDKFDLVHGETLEIHDEKTFREPEKQNGKTVDEWTDQRRTTTIVVLRDKETNALVLVTNRHMDHRSQRSQDLQFEKTDARIRELMKDYPVDARVDMGDFNGSMGAAQRSQKWDSVATSSVIDGIMAKGMTDTVQQTGERSFGRANSDDKFDHQMYQSTLSIAHNPSDPEMEKKQNLATQSTAGVVFYEDTAFRGKAWITGFGTDANRFNHKQWNDKTSSVRMTEDAQITLYDKADYSGKEITLSEDTSNIGKELNDKSSSWKWSS